MAKLLEVRIHGVSGTPPRDVLHTDPVSDAGGEGTAVFEAPPVDPSYRTLAFRWANLTSGSRLSAFWILLAPFALANTAGWMAGQGFEPSAEEGARETPHRFAHFAVRSAGIALTMVFVAQLTTALVHLPVEWHTGRTGETFDRALFVELTLAVAVLFVWLVSASTRSNFPEIDQNRTPMRTLFLGRDHGVDDDLLPRGAPDPAGATLGDPEMWTIHPILHRLRRVHLAAGLLALAAIVATRWGVVDEPVALVVLGVMAVGGGALVTWTGARGPTRWVTHALPLVASAVLLITLNGPLFTAIDLEPFAIHRVTLGLAVVTGLSALASGTGGWRMVGALVLASFFGAMLGTGLGLEIERRLRVEPQLVENGAGWTIAAMTGLVVVLLVVAVWRSFVGDGDPERGGTDSEPVTWHVRLRRAEIESRWLLVAAAVAGVVAGVATIGVLARGGFDPSELPALPDEVAVWLARAVVAAPFLFAVDSLWKGFTGLFGGAERRRQVGVLWDLTSFWPRWFHPLAPPAYSTRAVRDLQKAIVAMHDGALVGAHSQGSLILLVAMDRERAVRQEAFGTGVINRHLMTYGSQLGILYPRMFPLVGIPSAVDRVAGSSASWTNLWRKTDPIGGHWIDHDRVRNVLVTDGSIGHSRYETTTEYLQRREELIPDG